MSIRPAGLEPVLAEHLGPIYGCVRAIEAARLDEKDQRNLLREVRRLAENPGRLYQGSRASWEALGQALVTLPAADAAEALRSLGRELFTLDRSYGAQRRRFRHITGFLARADERLQAYALRNLPALLRLAAALPGARLHVLVTGLARAADGEPASRLLQITSEYARPKAREILAVAELVATAAALDAADGAGALIEALNRDADPVPLRRRTLLPALADMLREGAGRDAVVARAALATLTEWLTAAPLALTTANARRFEAALAAADRDTAIAYLSQLKRLLHEFGRESVDFGLGTLPARLPAIRARVDEGGRALLEDERARWVDALVTCAAWSDGAGALALDGFPAWVGRLPAALHGSLAAALSQLGPVLPGLGRQSLDQLVETAHALVASDRARAFLEHAGRLGATTDPMVEAFTALASAAAQLLRHDLLDALIGAFEPERITRGPHARRFPGAVSELSDLTEPWGSELWAAALEPCLSAAQTSPESALGLAEGLMDLLPAMPLAERVPYLAALHALVHHYGVRFVAYGLRELPAVVRARGSAA